MEALYTREEFQKQSIDFRIGAIVSDGMWWSIDKWKKAAKVSEEDLYEWIDKELSKGALIQSKTGAKSYRFPLTSIKEWYSKNNIILGAQLVDFLFPPRIWDDMTETEGFLKAPLREIGTVTFSCSSNVAREVIEALKGIARVRESEPGKYRAYSLSSAYTKKVIENVFNEQKSSDIGKVHSRLYSTRREMADFTPEFIQGLILFYKRFGKTLMKGSMDTIRIYLPDPEDQESQVIYWVISAVEKFDEKSSVPFSGYLNSALRHWPYDLPYAHLGKDLSDFQRKRSKAINTLKKTNEDTDKNFTNLEIAEQMGVPVSEFNELEEKHRVWLGARTATTLTWDESSDEKLVKDDYTNGSPVDFSDPSDIALANKLSVSVISAAINTGLFDDALSVISQIDSSEINMGTIGNVSSEYIQELGSIIGVDNE